MELIEEAKQTTHGGFIWDVDERRPFRLLTVINFQGVWYPSLGIDAQTSIHDQDS